MTIEFNAIPADLRTPGAYLEIDSSRAIGGLPTATNRALLIGQRLATGPANPLDLHRITSVEQARTFFGRGSTIAAMAKAFREADATTELWAIAGMEGTGTAATADILVSGSATAAGAIHLLIAGFAVDVPVSAGDAPTKIMTAIAAAINALVDLPVTAAATPEKCTVTAKMPGSAGNLLPVYLNFFQGQMRPQGVACDAGVMRGGVGDPDIAAVLARLGDQHYSTIVLGFNEPATLAKMEVELASRWGPMRMIEAMAYTAASGSYGEIAAFATGRNSQLLTIMGVPGLSGSATYQWAASYAATVASSAAVDPARPFQTLPLPGILPPPIAARATQQERDLLLRDGISTHTVRADGVAILERPITTYRTNITGSADIAFLDVTTVLTLAYLRYAVRARIAAKYPRHKLADDDTRYAAGQPIVTPKVLQAELVSLMREMEDAGLVENLDQFIADVRVERDPKDPNRINALIPPDVVNQFRVFAGRVQFRL